MRKGKRGGSSGWPDWDGQAEKILNGIRSCVERGGDNALMAFHADFLPILALFLDQLIEWTEHGGPNVRDWAGHALAERLRFLSAQEGEWSTNLAFQEAQKMFGDKRRARTPKGELGWLTENYVHDIDRERRLAPLFLDPRFADANINVAELLEYSEDRKKWLRELAKLDDLSAQSADQWVKVVYQRMRKDQKQILALPWIMKQPYPSRHFRENSHKIGKVRFSDYYPTIAKAVRSLALKPKGSIRGISRP